jgi:cytochrome c oxidase subunit 2
MMSRGPHIPPVTARGRRPTTSTFFLLLAVATVSSACGWVGWDWNTPMTTVIPKSDFAQTTHDIFMLISWTTLVIFIGVEGALLWACWRFREGAERRMPRQIHGHTILEVSWTVAFAVILVIIGIPTIRAIFKTQEAPAAATNALRVDVAGRQWWWEFKYPSLGITTGSELHLPAGQMVEFRLHGPDVIHSFWIPQLGGKRDVVPHRVNRLVLTPSRPGEYLGTCAEYCGESHANMRFRVFVHTQDEWTKWVAAQQATPAEPTDELAKKGGELFSQTACVGCHTIRGVSGGAIGPDLTHVGSRNMLAAGIVANTPENMVRWLKNPQAVKPGVLMPNLGLTDDQAKALTAYLMTLK